MKYLLLFLIPISVILFVVLIYSFRGPYYSVDKITEETCYNESLIDHKRYILPERWEKFGKEWSSYDWYKSCIENISKTSPIK